METNYASPAVKDDPRSQALLHHLMESERTQRILDGILYFDYPLFREADGTLYKAKVLLASRSHGVLLFGVSSLTDRTSSPIEVSGLVSELEQLYSILYAKILKSPLLRLTVRQLATPLQPFLFIPDVSRQDFLPADTGEVKVFSSFSTLDEWLADSLSPAPLTSKQFEELRAVLEGTKGLIRPKDRAVPTDKPHSKAAILRELEAEIATFDSDQRHAALSTVVGPQRIRGLAGSGKTVVLAMKAAHLHLADPEAKILLTFYTRSLYDFIRLLITRFYRHFNDRDPDWSRIHVLHAWGGRMLEGVYYNASLAADVTPLSLTDARASGQEPFDFVCSQLLATSRVAPQYDYVLVDEAQDFPTSFFRLCFALTKGPSEDRNVVWAYDELQTIMNVAMRQPRDLFGTDDLGTPLIDLRRSEERIRFGVNDIVLHKCYRNPREILVTAHAIGFGIYSDTTVQMLENKAHWEDLGYTVESGECIPGQPTSILRPEENSPLSISRRQTAPELIECYTAANLTDEIDWAVRSVYGLLQDGLRPDDIMIIALDDRNARGYFSSISSRLVTTGVKVNNVLADPYSRPRFFVENHVTLSTVYRAKGNEAPVVLCIGIDALYDTRQLLVTRNKLFTAFTRAKAWLKVSGVGKGAEALFREVQAALSHLPRMVFTYPDPSQLVILQRDLTDRAAKLQRLRDQLSHDFDSLDLSDEERDVLMSNLLKRK